MASQRSQPCNQLGSGGQECVIKVSISEESDTGEGRDWQQLANVVPQRKRGDNYFFNLGNGSAGGILYGIIPLHNQHKHVP
jgi:hypothetical protein